MSGDTCAKDKDTEVTGHWLKGKHGHLRTMLPHHLALFLRVGSIPTSLPPSPLGISHGATLEQREGPGASGLEKPSPSGRAAGRAQERGGQDFPVLEAVPLLSHLRPAGVGFWGI